MVLLPRMLDRLARLAHENDGAVGITQVVNNLFYVDLSGGRGIWLDVTGRDHITEHQLRMEETLSC